VDKHGELINSSLVSKDGKTIVPALSALSIYPSDQIGFPNNVAIAAMKKNAIVGYYLDKIHTKADVNFDEKNIEIISEGIKDLISKI
jgi:hypothetical protein